MCLLKHVSKSIFVLLRGEVLVEVSKIVHNKFQCSLVVFLKTIAYFNVCRRCNALDQKYSTVEHGFKSFRNPGQICRITLTKN